MSREQVIKVVNGFSNRGFFFFLSGQLVYDALVFKWLSCYSRSLNRLFGSTWIKASMIRHDTFINGLHGLLMVNMFIVSS